MKTIHVVIVSTILGIGLGVGTTWARLGHSPDSGQFNAGLPISDSVLQPHNGLYPRVEVDVRDHDFGIVQQNGTVDCEFLFTNRGEAPLTLTSGGTSCARCTVSKLPTSSILPGESANVVVQYHASGEASQFRQTATVLTNDPRTQRVELTVFGTVTSLYTVVPNKLVFSKLAPKSSATADVRIVNFMNQPLRIESFELDDPTTASFFDVKLTPLAPDQLTEPNAKGGYLVSVAIRPGMPLGTILQKIVLKTNLKDPATLVIPVEGSIDSEIAVSSTRYNSGSRTVMLGLVKRTEGLNHEISLFVRGSRRKDVKVSVAKVDPTFLKVKLGEPIDIEGGAVMRIPLMVSIPPNAPAGNHLETPGRILLATTHPEAAQVELFVSFAIEN